MPVCGADGEGLRGWLTKEGGRWKSWRRRYFVLAAGLLRYYRREGDEEPAGSISLASSGHIRGVAHRGVRNAFQVQTPSRTYVMYAATAAARDAWVEALNAALAALRPAALRRAVAPGDFDLVRLVRRLGPGERLALVRARSTGELCAMRTVELGCGSSGSGSSGHTGTSSNGNSCINNFCTNGISSTSGISSTNGIGSNSISNNSATAAAAKARAWVERHGARLLVLQNLPHPFLANVRHCFRTADRLYLVTDAVAGAPLAALLRAAPLPPAPARHLAAEVCLALGHLHRAGSAWPLVAPAHVVRTADGHACLRSLEPLGAPCPPDYRPPELLKHSDGAAADAPAYTCSCDWWCFGCFLFELLTASVCSFLKNNTSALQQHTNLTCTHKNRHHFMGKTTRSLQRALQRACQQHHTRRRCQRTRATSSHACSSRSLSGASPTATPSRHTPSLSASTSRPSTRSRSRHRPCLLPLLQPLQPRSQQKQPHPRTRSHSCHRPRQKAVGAAATPPQTPLLASPL